MANTGVKLSQPFGLLNLRAGRGQMNFQLAKSSFAFGMLFQYQFVCSQRLLATPEISPVQDLLTSFVSVRLKVDVRAYRNIIIDFGDF